MPETAIVTGGTSGLGAALVRRLMNEYHVVAVGRSDHGEPDDRRRTVVLGSVADPLIVDAAFSSALDVGRLRLVVNCAGIGIFRAPGNRTADDLRKVLEGNLVGTVLFSERASTELRSDGGLIVNVLSTAAHTIRATEAIYCAAKSGGRAYTEALRLELKGSSVGVMAVYPGGMNTRFWQRDEETKADASSFMDPEFVADAIVRHVLAGIAGGPYVSDITINRR